MKNNADHQVATVRQPVSDRANGRPAVLGGEPVFPEGIPFMRPTLPPWEALADPLRKIIESGMLTKGRHLEAFERAIAEYLGVKHAVGVSSCTTGLLLTCLCLDLHGEVLVPSFTFMATVHAMVWQQLTPVFVDVDPETWNINPAAAERAITPRTTAIVGVHVFGNPAPVEELERVAARHGLTLILDAAHGFGALHHGQPVGRYGHAEVFSSSPTKLLVTGEGGVVTTNDGALAERLRVAREYGNPGNYDSVLPGINARMQEFSAILGLETLKMLEENAQRRNALAARYQERLATVPGISYQKIQPYDRSSYKDLTIRINAAQFGLDRDQFGIALRAEGIGTRQYYVPPVHQHTTYRELMTQQRPHLPVTEALAPEVISLPIYSHMPAESVDRVCDAIVRIQTHAEEIAAALSAQRER